MKIEWTQDDKHKEANFEEAQGKFFLTVLLRMKNIKDIKVDGKAVEVLNEG